MALLQIDLESFTDLAVFLHQASDDILAVVLDLKTVSESDLDPKRADTWARIIQKMMSLNTTVTKIESILRAVLEEHKYHDPELPN